MKELFTSFKTYVIGAIIALAVGGLAAAGDGRWVKVASFDSYVEEGIAADLKAEIRYLRREMQSLQSDLQWEMDPARRAAIQAQLDYLAIELRELEEELEEYR